MALIPELYKWQRSLRFRHVSVPMLSLINVGYYKSIPFLASPVSCHPCCPHVIRGQKHLPDPAMVVNQPQRTMLIEGKGERKTNSDPNCSTNFTAQRSCNATILSQYTLPLFLTQRYCKPKSVRNGREFGILTIFP